MKRQWGMSLIEVSLSLAITGLVAVPLTMIVSAQLRIPAKISSNVVASRQIQRSTLVLIEDAQASEAFVVGSDPDYGTFFWKELAGPAPVEVNARYFFAPSEGETSGQVRRLADRGGTVGAPIVILDGIFEYGDVVFEVIQPEWDYDNNAQAWTYTDGKVVVSIIQIHEAGAEFGERTLTEALTADFRPLAERPVALPPPS
jgi:hypothetical protein